MREFIPFSPAQEECQPCLQLVLQHSSTQSFPSEDLPQGQSYFLSFFFLLPLPADPCSVRDVVGLETLLRLVVGDRIPEGED